MRLFSPRNLSRTAALSGGAEERRESALRTLRLCGEKEAWGAVARLGACCAARHGGRRPQGGVRRSGRGRVLSCFRGRESSVRASALHAGEALHAREALHAGKEPKALQPNPTDYTPNYYS